jgi:V/A-type H+-transporting ATPase subunit D
MVKLSFNKAALHKESARLKRYRQYLPSLDLKRQKLLAERYQAAVKLAQTQMSVQQCRNFIAENLPMISDSTIDLTGLVKVSSVKVDTENRIGNPLPRLAHLEIEAKPYSTFDTSHWVDPAVIQLRRMLELKIQLQIDQKRMEILDAAVKKITQRVNLFEKVLIPKAEMNIKKIRIFLSDAERAAVVRAKMTKQKRLKEGGRWLSSH